MIDLKLSALSLRSLGLLRNCLRTQVVGGKEKRAKNKWGRVVYPRCSPINKLETSGRKPPFTTCSRLSFIILICLHFEQAGTLCGKHQAHHDFNRGDAENAEIAQRRRFRGDNWTEGS